MENMFGTGNNGFESGIPIFTNNNESGGGQPSPAEEKPVFGGQTGQNKGLIGEHQKKTYVIQILIALGCAVLITAAIRIVYTSLHEYGLGQSIAAGLVSLPCQVFILLKMKAVFTAHNNDKEPFWNLGSTTSAKSPWKTEGFSHALLYLLVTVVLYLAVGFLSPNGNLLRYLDPGRGGIILYIALPVEMLLTYWLPRCYFRKFLVDYKKKGGKLGGIVVGGNTFGGSQNPFGGF